ncbi:MAG: HlyD family efflux transporter periplasmic adaptor subunit [Planctomycetota bacterium]|nr:HlyD family efflux transporter periplasmic adaptor subunit [Planctomycetota bacterium]
MPPARPAVDAAERSLPLRMRPDLAVRSQWFGRRRHWVLKDPLALNYFHLLDEEYAILQMLDGQTSLAQIKQRFEERFVPQRVSLPRLQRFLGDLHQRGLVLSDTPEQGEQLRKRRAQRRRGAWAETWGNLLAIRLPGVDPEPVLKWLAPGCRGLFSRAAVAAWLLAASIAAVLVVVQFEVLCSRLPDFRSFFQAGNLLWLVVTMALIKVLHELGHLLACQHFGAECHELGLMFLVFTPSLYCDVSDAWTLPNKWQRIAVSAAGVYVEVFLAAVCTFLWWFSEPGLLNSLCLNVMFVCSVSTLVFNGNPLMRFDGYYVLSDLLEVPNLQSRSRSALSRLLTWWSLGVDLPSERGFAGERNALLVGYALAAIANRWLVVVGTFFFLNAVLKPYRLEALAQAFMLVAVLGMLAAPAWRGSQLLLNPLWRRRIRRGRVLASLSLVLAVVAVIVLLPLPCRIQAPLLLQPEGAHHVYISAPGTLRETIRAGAVVEREATLARLVDLGIEQEIAKLTSECQQQRSHIRYLESQRAQDPNAAEQLPSARKLLAELDEQLQELRCRETLLTLVAPVDGTVIAAPRLTPKPPAPGRLPKWSGTPLDPNNNGSFLEAGTLLCLVGDPDRLQGVAMIEQSDVDFVQPGQSVKIQLTQLRHRIVRGTITEIAKIDLQADPNLLTAVGDLPARRDANGIPRPLTTAYQARIALDDHDEKLAAGAPGWCQITVAPQSLGHRILRYLSRTFRFSL